MPRGWSGSFRRTQETAGPAVINVDGANFQNAVVDRSFQIPVVVEVGVPNCTSCRKLSRWLRRWARDCSGQWALATIDANVAPRLVQALGVQTLPTMFMVLDGRLTLLWEGALARRDARGFIEILESEGARR
jgi:putative thioredoxin